MNYEILEALGQIAREKSVDPDLVVETLQAGLLSAAKRTCGTADNINVEVDRQTGVIKMYATKRVVEEVGDDALEISLNRAKELDADAKVGMDIAEEVDFSRFGRNAIQTAKQILVQRVREAERENIFEEYKERIGEIITGTVQQISRGDIIVNLGRTEAIIPKSEQIRREKYRQGDTVRAYVTDVQLTTKGPQVILSRAAPKFLERLFQLEVPEIYEGIVEIQRVAREPGDRSKIAVSSNDSHVDPVGACVGMKGSRVQAIVRELSSERIDIIPWSEDPGLFLEHALSPARVLRVMVDEDARVMTALVDEDQLSLAIGKAGQNARLAAALTGWKVDILSAAAHEQRERLAALARIPLTDLEGVGPKTADRLRHAGINFVQDVTAAGIDKIQSIPGIGRSTAQKMFNSARGFVGEELEEAPEEGADETAEEVPDEGVGETVDEQAPEEGVDEMVDEQASEEGVDEVAPEDADMKESA